MDLKSVKQLAELMDSHGLSSLEICEGEHKISLSRTAPEAPAPAVQAPQAQPASPAPSAQPQPEAQKPGEALKAPLVGVVYLAPSPDAPAFVEKGSRVKKGQTLCIIEAMKVMNEFCAPREGEVAEICVENGQLVEFGQCLLRLL